MSVHRPEHPVLNPISGTTINTSPKALGLHNDEPELEVDRPDSGRVPSEIKETLSSSKNILMRTVEQAAAKLSSSASSGLDRKSSDSKGQSRRLSDSRRLLSIRRKDKGKAPERDEYAVSDSQSGTFP